MICLISDSKSSSNSFCVILYRYILNKYTIVIPTFNENTFHMTLKEKYNYIYKNIDLSKLLKHDTPDLLKNKTNKQKKDIIMKHFILLPDSYVPSNIKTISSKKVIDELDNLSLAILPANIALSTAPAAIVAIPVSAIVISPDTTLSIHIDVPVS